MSDAEIIDRLRTILGDIAPDLDLAAVAPDADLRNDIGLDSMDFLNFVTAIHKRLGIDIPELDYPKLATLDSMIAYLKKKHDSVGG